MSSDLRKTLRKEIATRLAVVDVNTGHMIGDLANISSDGFMVLSREPVPMNSVFQLSLALPKVIQGVDTAYFGAESLWSNPTDDGGHYWIGFHIIDISKQDDEVLKWFLESV
jgi:hypothetical protein